MINNNNSIINLVVNSSIINEIMELSMKMGIKTRRYKEIVK